MIQSIVYLRISDYDLSLAKFQFSYYIKSTRQM